MNIIRQIIRFLAAAFLWSCYAPAGKPEVAPPVAIEATMPDSVKVARLLDALPSVQLPFSPGQDTLTQVDLSGFKSKALRDLSFQVNPSTVGGGSIEYQEDDSTFNVVDTAFHGYWALVQREPLFFGVVLRDYKMYYATFDYNLHLLDAIRITDTDPGSNRHFSAWRTAVIGADKTINLIEQYCVQVDEAGHMECDSSVQRWAANARGQLRPLHR